MSDFYSKEVINYYENPKNIGSLNENDPDVGTGIVGSPACGDVIKLQIKVTNDNIIEDAKFKVFGCGSAIATGALITESIKGKTIAEALQIKNTKLAEELSLSKIKIHCSVLAEQVLKAAIGNYLTKSSCNKQTSMHIVTNLEERGIKMGVTFTKAAADKIKELFSDSSIKEGIRINVSGNDVLIEPVKEQYPDDEVFEDKGIKTFMKTDISAMGTVIDCAASGEFIIKSGSSGCFCCRRKCGTSSCA